MTYDFVAAAPGYELDDSDFVLPAMTSMLRHYFRTMRMISIVADRSEALSEWVTLWR